MPPIRCGCFSQNSSTVIVVLISSGRARILKVVVVKLSIFIVLPFQRCISHVTVACVFLPVKVLSTSTIYGKSCIKGTVQL